MPQLDLSTYFAQMFWFVVCFAFLSTFLSFFVYPRLEKVLCDRGALVQKLLGEVSNVAAISTRIRNEIESAKINVKSEINAIHRKSRFDAKIITEEIALCNEKEVATFLFRGRKILLEDLASYERDIDGMAEVLSCEILGKLGCDPKS